MIARRGCLIALGSQLVAIPQIAHAQTTKTPRRVFILVAGSPDTGGHLFVAFHEGLRALGWREGDNILTETRWGQGKASVLDSLAAEAAAFKPDVIFAATSVAAVAAQRATKDIPIVFAVAADPIGSGLVANWARPGGRITGLSSSSREIGPKRLQLLKECVPALSRLVLLNDPAMRFDPGLLEAVQSAAVQLGIGVTVLNASTESELAALSASLLRERAQAMFVMESTFFFRSQATIIAQAATARLPAVYPIGEYADSGGLLVYGVNYPDQYRRAASYVDKILRGAAPGDLPVEQPIRFELIVNLKTAKALGLAIPQSVRLRADRFIE